MVVPGPIDTDMLDDVDDATRARASPPPFRSDGAARPTRSPRPIQFLCSDDAAFITGAALPVDGGLAMGALSRHVGRAEPVDSERIDPLYPIDPATGSRPHQPQTGETRT